MEEEFRKITGYENYSVSNYGNVRNDITEKIMKLSLRNRYFSIVLRKDGKAKSFNIHRLVASAFIENPGNKPFVDHINNDKLYNHVNNLRWCTNQENQMNASMNNRNSSGIRGVSWCKTKNKWRAQITINGKKIHIGIFNTLEEAAESRRRVAEQNFGNFMNACEKQPIIINNIIIIEKAVINN